MAGSKALEDFIDAVGIAEALVDLERGYQEPAPPAVEKAVLGLRGGASILVVAAFETFLREMFLERLSPLTQHQSIDFSKLPDKIRMVSIFESLNHAMKGRKPPPNKRLDRLPDVVAASRVVSAEILSPLPFSDVRSNPNSETVKLMFANLDVPQVLQEVAPEFYALWVKSEATTFIEEKLDEIVRRRNAVAHSVDVRKITRQQLAEAPTFLLFLAVALDTYLERRVEELAKLASR